MTETRPEREKTPRILAALEGQFRPRRYHREATLRPKEPLPAQLIDQVTRTLPDWNWQAPTVPAEEDQVWLDGNGAWMAAASSVRIAMEQLTNTGKMAAADYVKAPGYYLVRAWDTTHPSNVLSGAGGTGSPDPSLDLRSWSDRRFVSPLGRPRDGFVWLCEPTLTLLHELAREDQWWSDLTVHDSWTSETKTDLRDWTMWVDAQRLELKTRTGAEGKSAREVFKIRYAQAVEMLPGGVDPKTGRERCMVKRPDWYHAIIAQHRANQWRKVWRAILAGVEVIRVGGNDEVHVSADGYATLLQLQDTGRPPIGLHPTKLGKYDVKKPLGETEADMRTRLDQEA